MVKKNKCLFIVYLFPKGCVSGYLGDVIAREFYGNENGKKITERKIGKKVCKSKGLSC